MWEWQWITCREKCGENPRANIGYWTTRGYANSRTGHLVDWSTRGLDNSRTGQVTHGLDNLRIPTMWTK